MTVSENAFKKRGLCELKVYVIAESASNWSAAVALPYVQRALEDHEVSYVLRKIKNRSEARASAREAVLIGMDTVLAVGGDDIASEIAKELVGTRTALALVPCGPKRGLARTLGIPQSPESAVHTMLNGSRAQIDMGRVNGEPFLYAAMTGFPAEATERANRMTPLLPAPRPYLVERMLGGMAAFFTYRHSSIRLYHDHGSEDVTATMIGVCNGRFYGPTSVSPYADISDGYLDVAILDKTSRARLIIGLPTYAVGGAGRQEDYIRRIKTTYLRIEGNSDVVVTADGTRVGPLPIEFGVLSKGLNIYVPAALGNRLDFTSRLRDEESAEIAA